MGVDMHPHMIRWIHAFDASFAACKTLIHVRSHLYKTLVSLTLSPPLSLSLSRFSLTTYRILSLLLQNPWLFLESNRSFEQNLNAGGDITGAESEKVGFTSPWQTLLSIALVSNGPSDTLIHYFSLYIYRRICELKWQVMNIF
ncbi:hypothetical protein ACB092_01G049000 [Castanea dentata]